MKQICARCRFYSPLPKQPQGGTCVYPMPVPTSAALGEMQRIADKLLAKVPAKGGSDCPAFQEHEAPE